MDNFTFSLSVSRSCLAEQNPTRVSIRTLLGFFPPLSWHSGKLGLRFRSFLVLQVVLNQSPWVFFGRFLSRFAVWTSDLELSIRLPWILARELRLKLASTPMAVLRNSGQVHSHVPLICTCWFSSHRHIAWVCNCSCSCIYFLLICLFLCWSYC